MCDGKMEGFVENKLPLNREKSVEEPVAGAQNSKIKKLGNLSKPLAMLRSISI